MRIAGIVEHPGEARYRRAMFERLRFARYALRFERAFKSDDWGPVRECFHPDARYTIAGSGSSWDGETRGRDAIMQLFQRMLNELDRKLDQRRPRLTGFPRVRGGVLEIPWSARYTLRGESTVLTGRSQCRFDGGAIIDLRDTMVPDECARWFAMVARA
jgi:ketosteroid isomerase-like protein